MESNMKHEPSDPFLFPTILRGTWSETRRAWNKVAAKAWKAGSWTTALGELEYVSVFDDDKFVILDNLKPYDPTEEYWFVTWIYWSLYSNEKLTRSAEKTETLLFDGISHLWFLIGTFSRKLAARDRSKKDFERVFALSFFRQVVRYLPELFSLQGRLQDMASTMARPWPPATHSAIKNWQLFSLCYAYDAFPNRFGSHEEFNRRYLEFYNQMDAEFARTRTYASTDPLQSTSCVRVLLDVGIIEEHHDRFRIVPDLDRPAEES